MRTLNRSRRSVASGLAFGGLLMIASACGCGVGTRDLPALTTERTLQREAYDDRDWALTLAENIVDGRVNYAHLAAHPEPLWRYLTLLEHVGPQTKPDQFPSRGHALAYYVNAYNACAMRAVILEGMPDSMYRLDAAPFEQRYTFLVDGRRRTPGELRELARKAAGIDVRVEFCFCEPALGGVPVAAEPLRFDGLEQQLESISRAALNGDQVLRVDQAGDRLMVALWMFDGRERFVEWYRRRMNAPQGTFANALNALGDERCRQKLATAVGYRLAPIPFDRRLNRVETASP